MDLWFWRQLMATILVVEDNAALARLYSRFAEHIGCQEFRAATCKEAITKLEIYVPDAILLDCSLPDGSNLCVLNWMQIPAPRFHDLKVLVPANKFHYEKDVGK